MVHLDTQDMEKHRVELRVLLDRHRRRFNTAKQQHTFEEIVRAELNKNLGAPEDGQQPNCIRLDSIDQDGANLLARFLENLINGGHERQQHELLQQTLRLALQNSRRQSILVHSREQGMAGPLEPFCLFCASDLPVAAPPITGGQVFFPDDLAANGGRATLDPAADMHQPAAATHHQQQVIPSIQFVTHHQQITPPNSAAPTPDVASAGANTEPPAHTTAYHQYNQPQQYYRAPAAFPVGQMDVPIDIDAPPATTATSRPMTVGKQPSSRRPIGRPPKTTLEAASGGGASSRVQLKMSQSVKKQVTNASQVNLETAPASLNHVHNYARPVELNFQVVPPSSSDSDDNQQHDNHLTARLNLHPERVQENDNNNNQEEQQDDQDEDIDLLNDDDYRIDSVKNHLDNFHETMMEPMASSTMMIINHDAHQPRRRSSTPLSDAPTDPDIALVTDESCRAGNLSQASSIGAAEPSGQPQASAGGGHKSSSELEYSQASSRPPSRAGNKSLDQVSSRLLQQAVSKRLECVSKQPAGAAQVRHSAVKLITQPVQSVIIKQKFHSPTSGTAHQQSRSQQPAAGSSGDTRRPSTATYSQQTPTGGIKTKQTVKRRNKRRY